MKNKIKNFEKTYTNLSGGINLATSKTGLIDISEKLFWDDSYNVEILKNFGVKTVKGNMKIAQNPNNKSIIGITDVENTTGDFVFVDSEGKIYFCDRTTGTITLLKTLDFAPSKFDSVKFLGGVLILTGTNNIQYVKRRTAPEITEINIEGVDGSAVFGDSIAVFASRVWVSAGSVVYFSSLGTYDNWTEADNAGYISKFHSSESEIVAMTEYLDKLAIYKSDGIYLLSGNTTSDFAVSKFGNIGTISAKSVISANNKQYFINKSGVWALEEFGELGQIGLTGNIGINLTGEFQKIIDESASKTVVVELREKNQIWFFVPYIGCAGISTVFVFDYYNKSWTKRLIPYEITAAASVKGKILTTDSTGKIFEENVGNTFSGKPIQFNFSTPFFNFSKPNTLKTIGEVNLILDEEFENAFKISVCKDYTKSVETDVDYIETISPKTLVFVASATSSDKYNSTWQASGAKGGSCWAEPIEGGYRIEVFDCCTSFQLNFSYKNAGDGFGLVGIEFRDIIFEEN